MLFVAKGATRGLGGSNCTLQNLLSGRLSEVVRRAHGLNTGPSTMMLRTARLSMFASSALWRPKESKDTCQRVVPGASLNVFASIALILTIPSCCCSLLAEEVEPCVQACRCWVKQG